MNICSFVPGATEVIAALGLADRLVGISHECDYPSSVRHAPVLIEPATGGGHSTSQDIDRQVKALRAAAQPLYRLDVRAFCAAQPDLILTQDLCHVCALTPAQLTHAVRLLPQAPRILSLHPNTLEEVIRDVERIGDAAGQRRRSLEFAGTLRRRLDAVQGRLIGATRRPRVACLEWLDPLYVAGHWVPEMVRLAGGFDILGQEGRPSRETSWEEVAAAQPDLLIAMPCGYSIERTMAELASPGPAHTLWAHSLRHRHNIAVVEAASYFSRPGPRLIDGVELLEALFHPSDSLALDPSKAVRLAASALVPGTAS
jgi:iron complex transport system substrate-binding protein